MAPNTASSTSVVRVFMSDAGPWADAQGILADGTLASPEEPDDDTRDDRQARHPEKREERDGALLVRGHLETHLLGLAGGDPDLLLLPDEVARRVQQEVEARARADELIVGDARVAADDHPRILAARRGLLLGRPAEPPRPRSVVGPLGDPSAQVLEVALRPSLLAGAQERGHSPGVRSGLHGRHRAREADDHERPRQVLRDDVRGKVRDA